jgi:hypothetical protein
MLIQQLIFQPSKSHNFWSYYNSYCYHNTLLNKTYISIIGQLWACRICYVGESGCTFFMNPYIYYNDILWNVEPHPLSLDFASTHEYEGCANGTHSHVWPSSTSSREYWGFVDSSWMRMSWLLSCSSSSASPRSSQWSGSISWCLNGMSAQYPRRLSLPDSTHSSRIISKWVAFEQPSYKQKLI